MTTPNLIDLLTRNSGSTCIVATTGTNGNGGIAVAVDDLAIDDLTGYEYAGPANAADLAKHADDAGLPLGHGEWHAWERIGIDGNGYLTGERTFIYMWID